MKRINFNISDNIRKIILLAVVVLGGVGAFSAAYFSSDTGAVVNQTSGQFVAVNVGGANGPKKISEAHWQGMEVVPLTWELASKLGIPLDEKGVLIDEVTLTASRSGFMAMDIINAVNGVSVTTINDFYIMTKRLKDQKKALIDIKRANQNLSFTLAVPDELGFAQLESPPMVLAGSIPPHRYRGPCSDCHEIGSTGQLDPDPDLITLAPPPISKMAKCPHRYRGACKMCHVVVK